MEILFTTSVLPAAPPVPKAVRSEPVVEVATDRCELASAPPLKVHKKKRKSPTVKPRAEASNKGPTGSVKFSYNPQDKLVMEPETYTVGSLGADISTSKVVLNQHLDPGKDGSYVFDGPSDNFTAAAAFATAARTVDIFSKAYGEIHWAFGAGKLKINPDIGEKLNANYQRGDSSVNFYHATDTATGQVVRSGDSGEVVAHEVGHAMLDAIRPGYHYSFSLEPKAFHESFGDVTAFLASLQDDRVVAQVAAQTGGDLTKANLVAASGEELGKAINDNAGWNRTGGDWVRNLNNNLKWVSPDSLGKPEPGSHPDSSQIFFEGHNFSRIWSGAVYEIVSNLVAENVKNGQAPAEAIKNASTEGIAMYGRLMKDAPEGDFTFKDMGNAFIKSDQDRNGGKHVELLKRVLTERNILPASLTEGQALPMGTHEVTTRLEGPEFGRFAGAEVSTRLSGEGHGLVGEGTRLQGQVAKLIELGEVKYTEPGQVLSTNDLLKPDGHPYTAVVRWDGDQMRIERVDILD